MIFHFRLCHHGKYSRSHILGLWRLAPSSQAAILMENPEKLAPNTFPNRKSECTSSDEEQPARQVDTEPWFKMVLA